MKSLDKVIDDFEKACDLKRRCEGCSGCLSQENGCPNDGAESVPDALHYLKEYQKILPLVPSLINTAIEVLKKGKTIG